MIETKIDVSGDTLANLDQARNSISGREMTRHYENKYGRTPMAGASPAAPSLSIPERGRTQVRIGSVRTRRASRPFNR